MKIKESTFRALRLFAVALLVIYALFGYQYKMTYNSGSSMYPTLSDGEWVFVERRERLPEDWTPGRYDIVIITDNGTGESLIKRVIGLPGDTIEVKEGSVFINEEKIRDPYGKGRMFFILTDQSGKDLHYWGTTDKVIQFVNQAQITIDEGFVWVVGDNRPVSWFGELPIKNIKGLVIF